LSAHEPLPSRKTPREILEQRGLYRPDIVAVMAEDKLYDLHTPIDEAAELVPITANERRALDVIRHSTAHVMADAVQRLFPKTRVTIGPSIENGFYYDFDRPDGHFTDADLERIETTMREIIAGDHPFKREVIDKDDARELFRSMGENYKLELLDTMQGEITIYRHGDWIDLCRGPHVPSTRFLQAVKLTSVAGAYWRGDERNPMLQRIYGTAFSTEKELRTYLAQLEEAKKRDHRKLGKELELFAFSPLAAASPFFLPRGAAIYNGLMDYIRALYRKYAYDEVITPQLFDRQLFFQSGHLPEYTDGMFFVTELEDAASSEKAPTADLRAWLLDTHRFALKSMNCPGHAHLFSLRRRSYRELPLRMADFGRLHRFERSGVTQGLTRVRTFCQDDAHIFCTLDQIQSEISSFLTLVDDVYRDFAFNDVRIVIATRPASRLGADELWDRAEQALFEAVKAQDRPHDVAPGEGAFYGPKIEFHLKDAIGRDWQLGTIQVDFNMPERFELSYVDSDNQFKRPVMLHRAILGSVERFFGILIEHTAGAFPVWLAPEQLCLLTVSDSVNDYALEAQKILASAGIRVVIDASNEKLGAKIRRSHQMRYPYVGVIGQKELEHRGLSIRVRGEQKDLGLLSLDQVMSMIKDASVPPSSRRDASQSTQ